MTGFFQVVPICLLHCCFSRPAITAGRSGGVADGVEYRNQFLRLPLNPNIESTFVGVSNYVAFSPILVSGTRCG